MSWFIFSIIALVCWSGSDFFSKSGTQQKDKNSHWKVIFAVGLIMGIHFLITLIGGAIIDDPDSVPKFIASLFYTDFTFKSFLIYLPIAFIYILAMLFGYIGLRYIELSISSPICNSSGSLALLICAIIWFGDIVLDVPSIIGVVLVALGILALGFVQYTEDDEMRALRQEKSLKKYTKSWIALILPIIYLIIDALGTVGDQYLANLADAGKVDISDYASNSAFEVTFVLFAIFAFCWLKFKKHDKVFVKENKAMYIGGVCETLGQVFYMAVMFDNSDGAEVGMVIISAYCALSVLWSRIFLKEKLSWKHYVALAITFAGIVLLGIFSEV